MVDYIGNRCVEHDIITEEDLQFVCYSYLLGLFIKPHWNDRWRAFNKLHDKKVSKYPDLTLFRERSRRVVVELKQEVGRSVTKEDIGADITKISNILSSDEELKFGVVLATIFDEHGVIQEWLLSEYREQLENERLRLILIDISAKIEDITNWKREQEQMELAFRGK